MRLLAERAWRFWGRHRTLIWMLHSVWSLLFGIAIVLLARERYHLVLWVVVFLVLTWGLTLFFGRAAVEGAPAQPGVVQEVTSYVIRVLYQETLFFLIPFYASSTVAGSLNVLFLALLIALAALSCLDLVFDRLLRTRPIFALAFFAVVAFAAVNLLLPIVMGLPLPYATPAAAALAVGGALPLVLRTGGMPRPRVGVLVASAILLAVAIGLPRVIPPVPLRLERATFASGIERGTLKTIGPLSDRVSSAQVGGSLAVLVEVFAPSALPASVRLEWRRDSTLLRVSRNVDISAHTAGFRVWDAWHAQSGPVPPGRYRVVLKTADARVFGVATLTVHN